MEAALVFPVLLSLTFGSIEFGYFFYVKHTLQGAAREGARQAIIRGSTNTDVTSVVTQSIRSAGFPTGAVNTAVIRSVNSDGTLGGTMTLSGSTASGTPIAVVVSATWSNIGVRPLGIISSSKVVSGRTVMRRE